MFATWIARLDRWADTLVPVAFAPRGGEAHRRARLVAYFAMICTAIEMPYGVMFAAMGVPMLSVVSFGFLGAFFGAIALLRRGRITLAGAFITAMFGAQLLAQAVPTGGLRSPALWSMIILPSIAQLMIGGRAGRWGAAVVGAVGLGFGAIAEIVGPLPSILPPRPVADGTVPGALCLALVGCMSIYERIEVRMRTAIEEQKRAAEAAHAHVRLVLDSVDQGFLLLDAGGRVLPGGSAAVAQWFSEAKPGVAFADALAAVDKGVGQWFALGWEAVTDGFMPLELTLSQLPSTATVGGATLRLSYRSIGERFVVMISDVTAEIERKRAEDKERELVSLFLHLLRDRSSFIRFVQDTSRLVAHVVSSDGDRAALARSLHTIKGNVGFFGLGSLVAICHAVETAVTERGEPPNAAERASIGDAWNGVLERVSILADPRASSRVELDHDEYTAFLGALDQHTDHVQLLLAARAWPLERARRPLGFVAQQAQRLAERLGRGTVEVEVDDGGIRLDPGPWAPFWSSLVHVIRNAVDHGLEPPDERRRMGKPEFGRIELRASLEGSRLQIDVTDDGRGIDWDRIREVALARGLPTEGPDDLVRALFADGMSSKVDVTEVSGRGVGMGAVAEATEALGGSIEILSTRGRGTTVRFGFASQRSTEVYARA